MLKIVGIETSNEGERLRPMQMHFGACPSSEKCSFPVSTHIGGSEENWRSLLFIHVGIEMKDER